MTRSEPLVAGSWQGRCNKLPVRFLLKARCSRKEKLVSEMLQFHSQTIRRAVSFKVHKVVVFKRVSVLKKIPREKQLLLKKHQRGVWDVCPVVVLSGTGSSSNDVLATAVHGQFGPWRPCVLGLSSLRQASSVLLVRWIGEGRGRASSWGPLRHHVGGQETRSCPATRFYRDVLCVQRNQRDPVQSFANM